MKLCREHVDYISSTISTLDSYITELSKPYKDLISLASDVPSSTENSVHYIIAIAHMMLVYLYHMFLKKEIFQPSDIHYDELPKQLLKKRKHQYIQRAIKLLENEGMTVMPPSIT